MARIEIDPNYSSPTFSRATAGTDLFKKEDVQALAAAVSTHDHTTGKGAVLAAGSIPAGSITSAMIADGTIVAGDIADGAVTSAKILDGTIATIDLADAAVTNAKLASDTARANLLTNGGFEIWQRGSGPFTATNAYTADRWTLGLAGTDTLSVSRDGSNPDAVLGGALNAACTFVLGSGAGGTAFSQVLKWADCPVSRTLTASVRVRTSTANAVRIGLHNGSAWTYSAFHSGGGSYETLTATATIGYGGNAQLSVLFAASCTAYIDNAMLVVGSQAADYAPLHPADDLARCQRYYQRISIGIRTKAVAANDTFATTVGFIEKAVTPTTTLVVGTAVNNAAGWPLIQNLATNGSVLQTLANIAGDTYWFGSCNLEANP